MARFTLLHLHFQKVPTEVYRERKAHEKERVCEPPRVTQKCIEWVKMCPKDNGILLVMHCQATNLTGVNRD